MKNYYEKILYLARKQKGSCAIALAYNEGYTPQELHHRLHKTKLSTRAYPLFIDSVWNLVAVNHDMHMMHPAFGKISILEAAHREAFLERHPTIARAINFKGEI